MTSSFLPFVTSEPADEAAPSVTSDPPGTYPTGLAGLVRAWDGHAWAATSTVDLRAPVLPKPPHSYRLSWRFWAAAGALVVGVVVAAFGGARAEPVRTALLVVAAVISTGGALLALTSAVWHRLRLADAVRSAGWSGRRLVGLGATSGVLAVGIALGAELALGRVLGRDSVAVLFLAGPIEETAKLVLPVVLLVVMRDRLADPRHGFALVWVSGATFGLVEGVEYVAGLGPKSSTHLPTGEMATVVDAAAMTAIRTLVELMHPMLTAAAAAALWLAVRRGGRLLARAGVTAFLVAVLLHSVNDGVLGGWAAHVSAGLSLAGSPLMLVLIYLVLRSRARELVPPSRVTNLPGRWRPRSGRPADGGGTVAG